MIVNIAMTGSLRHSRTTEETRLLLAATIEKRNGAHTAVRALEIMRPVVPDFKRKIAKKALGC